MDQRTREAVADLIEKHADGFLQGKADLGGAQSDRSDLVKAANALSTLCDLMQSYCKPNPPAWGVDQAAMAEGVKRIARDIRDPKQVERDLRAGTILGADKTRHPDRYRNIETNPGKVKRYLILSHVRQSAVWADALELSTVKGIVATRLLGGHTETRVYDLDREAWGTPLRWDVSVDIA